ncbi:hypothetical protein ACP4OV_017322 [Aristida adscensionis]
MAAAGGEGNKTPSFRWLRAARCAVATAVTAVIVVVIVNAVAVLLRPDSLSITILRGTVFVRRVPRPPPATLLFRFNFRAANPSGRARMYYVNATAFLFDKDTPAWSASPDNDSVVATNLRDEPVQQQGTVEALTQIAAGEEVIKPGYFRRLMRYNGAGMPGFTLRLQGSLITEIRSGYNTTPHWTVYYCGPLLLVTGDPNDQAYEDLHDVLCREQTSICRPARKPISAGSRAVHLGSALMHNRGITASSRAGVNAIYHNWFQFLADAERDEHPCQLVRAAGCDAFNADSNYEPMLMRTFTAGSNPRQ